MKLKFEYGAEREGTWQARFTFLGEKLYPPYKIVKYEWFDEFSGRSWLRRLEKGQPFFAAYIGQWYRGKPMFGNHVERDTEFYQTFLEASMACENHYKEQQRE